MIKRDTIAVYAIGALVLAPAIMALSAYHITRNPSLRPLGITIEQLIEAGQIADKTLITVEVSIGEHAKTSTSLADYKKVMADAFGVFNTEARVRFREVDRSKDITVLYIVGNSEIGPYAVSRAAEGIRPAVEAERMVTKQRTALAALEKKRIENGTFWQRVFSD